MQAISQAIDAVGGVPTMASLLGVSTKAVYFWRDGRRKVPVDKMAQIERLTGRLVRRWDLRPDDWHRIWPELIGAPGAPEPRQEVANG